ncbi:MAG: HAMP domain-containing histidine kinase [Deltaproteobacteria bacterium]|nr:HAMP domain-containing histidine kinase [Deltaproteobacteria bacterium]
MNDDLDPSRPAQAAHAPRGVDPTSTRREDPAVLHAQVRAVVGSPIVRALLEGVDGGVVVLNARRQIVALSLQRLLSTPEEEAHQAVGKRLGEALECSFARDTPAGCGTADACRYCGALRTILACQSSASATEGDLQISARNGTLPLELHLRATPVEVGGYHFTVLAMRDVRDELRRRALEQIFFHDLLNTFTPLATWSRVLRAGPRERMQEAGERVARLVGRVESEIRGQRTLLLAESGTLGLTPEPLGTSDVLRELVAGFDMHPLTVRRTLQLEDSPEIEIETDRSLLLRVLTNMATNALEATPEGGCVRAWCQGPEAGAPWECSFHVHNEGQLPPDVARRVFQRSFSTKAQKGRGLGTYGMKLLGERYLGGQVSFDSREREGTTFVLRLPRRPPPGPELRRGSHPSLTR